MKGEALRMELEIRKGNRKWRWNRGTETERKGNGTETEWKGTGRDGSTREREVRWEERE